MMTRGSFSTFAKAENSSVSVDLSTRIQLGLEELARIRNQMAAPSETRPAVITADLIPHLAELLAFRHLFRGASIALMRWDKLSVLVAKVDSLHDSRTYEVSTFSRLPVIPAVRLTYFLACNEVRRTRSRTACSVLRMQWTEPAPRVPHHRIPAPNCSLGGM